MAVTCVSTHCTNPGGDTEAGGSEGREGERGKKKIKRGKGGDERWEEMFGWLPLEDKGRRRNAGLEFNDGKSDAEPGGDDA